MDNVINFKEIKARKEKEHFDNLVEDQISDEELFTNIGVYAALDIISLLEEEGYDPRSKPECIRDIMMVIESIRGLAHRLADMDHTMHLVSDTIFKIFANEEEVLEEFLEKLYEEE